jgi:Na+/phosphate symporter
LAIFLIIKTHAFHHKKTEEQNKALEKFKSTALNGDNIYETCSENVTSLLIAGSKALTKAIDSLVKEKRKKLKADVMMVKDLNKQAKSLKKEVPRTLQRLTEESFESAHSYIEVIEFMREMMHCLSHVVVPSFEHVDNNHAPLTANQQESLYEISRTIQAYIAEVVVSVSNSDFGTSDKTISKSQEITEMITKIRKKQLKNIKKEPGSTRTNMLFMDILTEIKNLILHLNNIYKAFRDLSERNIKLTLKSV